jgi:hypothetical protein
VGQAVIGKTSPRQGTPQGPDGGRARGGQTARVMGTGPAPRN